MKDQLYLAMRRMTHHWPQSLVLISVIATIVSLPVCLQVLLSESTRDLSARAAATPLLLGAKGSPLELTLNSLYFESTTPSPTTYRQLEKVIASGRAKAIPLYNRFQTRRNVIVGTSLDYFEFRGLRTERGRLFGMLGECVVGSEAARMNQVEPGDFLISSPGSVFDVAGVYPLKMRVVGVLEPTGDADDRAVFVDLHTTWVIEGLAHGHTDLFESSEPGEILRQDAKSVTANASLEHYTEITAENVDSFHFHGDSGDFPITAAIIIPTDDRAAALVQSSYLGREATAQVIRPIDAMGQLQTSILSVKRFVLMAVALLSVATLATMTLVLALSIQLRKPEFDTMAKIGASNAWLVSLVCAETMIVVGAGFLLAAGISVLAVQYVDATTRWLIRFV